MRDDLNKLPLPPEAKAYARRSGMKALKRQPQQFINMVASLTNQKNKKHGFKNTNAAGKVPHAIKEDARHILKFVLENDPSDEPREFRVWLRELTPDQKKEIWAMEVPTPGEFVNYLTIPTHLSAEQQQSEVEQRLRLLAKTRNYPPGSFFNTPWGLYLIHGNTIGKI